MNEKYFITSDCTCMTYLSKHIACLNQLLLIMTMRKMIYKRCEISEHFEGFFVEISSLTEFFFKSTQYYPIFKR